MIRFILWCWQRLPFTAGCLGGQPEVETNFSVNDLSFLLNISVSVSLEFHVEYHGFRKATASTIDTPKPLVSPSRCTLVAGTLFLNIETQRAKSNWGKV